MAALESLHCSNPCYVHDTLPIRTVDVYKKTLRPTRDEGLNPPRYHPELALAATIGAANMLTQDAVTGASRLRLSNRFTGVAHGRVQLLRWPHTSRPFSGVAMLTTSARCSALSIACGV